MLCVGFHTPQRLQGADVTAPKRSPSEGHENAMKYKVLMTLNLNFEDNTTYM